MSAVALQKIAPRASVAPRLALLGTGVVGTAFVERYARLQSRGLELPALAWLANSRAVHACDENPAAALQAINDLAPSPQGSDRRLHGLGLHAGDVVVDATASETVADSHAHWLRQGVHVVTANKLGNGSDWSRAQAIAVARAASGAGYGDAATVGAGLPLLGSLRALVAGGDNIHKVEGVLSGSLAWLFNHYDGMRPFSGFVREARDAGYTEPDPRIDLSGEDVRRKLLILARAAGLPMAAESVSVRSLVPKSLAVLPLQELDAALPAFDAPLRQQFEAAYRQGERLRFIGRFDGQGASVGLQALPADHPLCGGAGTDNRVAIFSDRYPQQPLLIQGPGAGAEVTAAALLDDVLRVVRN